MLVRVKVRNVPRLSFQSSRGCSANFPVKHFTGPGLALLCCVWQMCEVLQNESSEAQDAQGVLQKRCALTLSSHTHTRTHTHT